jgi:drug/metabolite transporter (DMT)-like permease
MQIGRKKVILRVILLIFGVLCGSTAVIMVKASTEHPFLVSAYRLLIASVCLSPFFFRELRSSTVKYGWRELSWSALPALALAVHLMSWVYGARMTAVANASLIANLTPVAMPFFIWIFYRERVGKIELFGTAFTLVGLVILTSANLRVSQEHFTGDMICFGSMLGFAVYLALGRKNGARLGLWLYMVPLYFFAGIICLICACFVINPIKVYTLDNLLYMLGLGLIPTVFGHTILNYSMKFFRGQVVSVTNLAQPVFAGVLGFLIFREVPSPIFYLAALMVIGGVLIVLNEGWVRNLRTRSARLKEM